MTQATPDIPNLLRDLTALPAGAREERLRREGHPDELIAALADEVERLAISENARAIDAGEVVAALARACAAASVQTRATRAQGQALAYGGRFDDALNCFESAVQIAERASLPVEAARARMTSMHALGTLGRLDDAIAAGSAARAAFDAAGERVLTARADANLGTIHQFRDEPIKALEHLDRARVVMVDDPIACAQLDSNRARALMSLNEFDAAQEAYRAALPPFEQAEMFWAAAIVEGNLADLATRQGRLQQALYHFERARRHLERDAALGELARLRVEQAAALTTMGLLDDACEAYRAALPELEKQNAALEVMRARAGLARALVRLGRFDEAEDEIAWAAQLMRTHEQPLELARLDLDRAQIAVAKRDYARAVALMETAIGVLAPRRAEAAAARQQLALVRLEAGDPSGVLVEVERALPAAELLDLAPLRADLLYTRGAARRVMGDAAGAVVDLRSAVEQVERVRGTLQAERFRAAFHRNRISIYEDLVATTLDAHDAQGVAEAFETIERAKSRSLLDLVQRGVDLPDVIAARATEDDDRALATELSRERATLSGLYSRLADAAGDDGVEAAERLRGEIQRREKSLQTIESRLATAGTAAGLLARPIDLPAAQRLAPQNGAIVEYFSASDELLALVITADGARVFRRLARTAEVAERARRVHFQVRRALRPGETSGPRAARLLEDVRIELAALHALVFAPLRAALRDVRKLVLVPHGALHTAPLHALWDGRKYLIEDFDISTAPSASTLAHTADRALPARGQSLVIGVADEQAPQIGIEARELAIALRAERVLLDADATVAAASTAMSDADLVHIAAHGHYSAENPLGCGLKLADRWMNVRDIYAMKLRCGLLTLSGCETGRTQIAAGDDLLGLTRGFLAAGAGALIVSLWSVQDDSTAELMREFYATLGRGGERPSIAAALRDAQRKMLARRPHPALWAPFVLVGKA